MSWAKLFFDNDVYDHIVSESMIDTVVDDLYERHGASLIRKEEVKSVRIDPGGLYQGGRDEHRIDLEGLELSFSDQHMWFVPDYIRQSARERAGGIKVNAPCGGYYTCCIILPLPLHTQLCAEVDQLAEQYDIKRGIKQEDAEIN